MAKKKQLTEISPTSYYDFLLWFLKRNRGHCTQADLETAVKQVFSPHWKPADKRIMRVGEHGKQRKWQNSLAWAKVLAHKRQQLFQCKTGKGKENLVLVAGWLVAVSIAGWQRRTATSMRKDCERCGRKAALSAVYCERCGRFFPQPTNKIVLPLSEILKQAEQQRNEQP